MKKTPNQFAPGAPAKKQAPAKPAAKSAPAKPSTELKVVDSDLANSQILDDIIGDAGAGSESMGRDDLAIPRLSILQALSPQCKKREATYIDGAEEGMIFDTVGHHLFDGEEGILVIPCSYRRTNIEWAPRDSGGGFINDHGNDDSVLNGCTKNEKGQLINRAGNLIVPTAEYFVMVYDPETNTATPYVLSMSSTQLKHSRRWNTLMNTLRLPNPRGGTFNPAMFYCAYRLTTSPESNDSGSWFGWDVKRELNVVDVPDGNNLYFQCRAFRESVMQGAVKAAVPDSPSGGQSDSDADDGPM